ncbi:unnamed protein product, partial [Ectocarpus sp. 8 AP-2014]
MAESEKGPSRSHGGPKGGVVTGAKQNGAEGTAKAAGNDDTTTGSRVADDGNLGAGSDVGNTLWEQMTAREGKDAARRAGMRAGDWQAERQLQEALRESRRDGGPVGVASSLEGSGREEDEASFVDTGFHALATNAVEGEEGEGEAAAAADTEAASSRGQQPTGGSSAAAAGATAGDGSTAAQEEKDGEVEEEEDYGDVELVVTQDGGIIPVAAGAVSDGSAAAGVQETP